MARPCGPPPEFLGMGPAEASLTPLWTVVHAPGSRSSPCPLAGVAGAELFAVARTWLGVVLARLGRPVRAAPVS